LRIRLAAPATRRGVLDRLAREDRDPVVARLAVDERMAEAEAGQGVQREQLVPYLGLLQTQDVRPERGHQPLDAAEPGPHRIDVPGRDPDVRLRSRSVRLTIHQSLPGILTEVHAILGIRLHSRWPGGVQAPTTVSGMSGSFVEGGEDRVRRRPAPDAVQRP
jgi:hypothetical protein